MVSHVAGPRHLRAYEHDRRDHAPGELRREPRGVVDAVLEAEHDGIRREMRRELRRGLLAIGGFDAAQHELCARSRGGLGARARHDALVEGSRLHAQARAANRVDVRRAPDQRDRVSRPRASSPP